mmetsp:Transcript_563/g.1332  ORF Transcript_563/g.1332 Transcript_563/m.1332 type:complete len:107 (-) Transcript_563:1606-1926(-)
MNEYNNSTTQSTPLPILLSLNLKDEMEDSSHAHINGKNKKKFEAKTIYDGDTGFHSSSKPKAPPMYPIRAKTTRNHIRLPLIDAITTAKYSAFQQSFRFLFDLCLF